jgi:hypothetical protein
MPGSYASDQRQPKRRQKLFVLIGGTKFGRHLGQRGKNAEIQIGPANRNGISGEFDGATIAGVRNCAHSSGEGSELLPGPNAYGSLYFRICSALKRISRIADSNYAAPRHPSCLALRTDGNRIRLSLALRDHCPGLSAGRAVVFEQTRLSGSSHGLPEPTWATARIKPMAPADSRSKESCGPVRPANWLPSFS